jgi:hypothetical protein
MLQKGQAAPGIHPPAKQGEYHFGPSTMQFQFHEISCMVIEICHGVDWRSYSQQVRQRQLGQQLLTEKSSLTQHCVGQFGCIEVGFSSWGGKSGVGGVP